MSETEREPEGGRSGPRRWSVVRPAAALAVAAVIGWSYAPEFRSLWESWVSDPNYSHGFFVIPVALAVYWRRGTLPGPAESKPLAWAWGVLFLTLAARVWFYDRGNLWAETMTLLASVLCLALTLGGWRMLRRAWPAVAYLVFMVPLPTQLNNVLAQPLQSLATSASCGLLKLTGLWVIAEGNIIYVGKQPLVVAEACNGLSMMMCLAATVMAMALLVPMSAWMRAVLTLSVVPVALASNVLRIVVTAWCYQRYGPEVGGRFAHDAAGLMMMPTALLAVGLETLSLKWLVVEERVPVDSQMVLLR